mmetsp:Transcript_21126/g.28382  ORF Transcript_21126/g.28382 Transcript_21126/m.28382 type:complete len:154 (+) Transcript_21126:49-510(+)
MLSGRCQQLSKHLLVARFLRIAVPIELSDGFLQVLLVFLCLFASLMLLTHHEKRLLLRLSHFSLASLPLAAHLQKELLGAAAGGILPLDVLGEQLALQAHLLRLLGLFLRCLLLVLQKLPRVLLPHANAFISLLVILNEDDHHVVGELVHFDL